MSIYTKPDVSNSSTAVSNTTFCTSNRDLKLEGQIQTWTFDKLATLQYHVSDLCPVHLTASVVLTSHEQTLLSFVSSLCEAGTAC